MSDVKLEQELNIRKEFPVPTYDEWKAVVEKDLKGEPFEKKLLTKTYEGITLQPIYTRKDVENLPQVNNTPGYQYYVRGTKASGYLAKSWDIAQELPYSLPEDFNEALKHDLAKGQTAVNILLDKATQAGIDADKAKQGEVGGCGLSVSTVADLEKALKGIDLTKVPVYVGAGYSALPFISLLAAYAKKSGLDLAEVSGSVEADPFSALVVEGKLPVSLTAALDELATVAKWAAKNAPKLKVVGVSGLNYNNAGASAVQELAYVISTAVAYLEALTERGLSINEAAKSFRFSFGIGANYFMEVAKLRAARYIWAKIVEAYGGDEEAQRMTIHGRTSIYNQTVYDPYVNMLRTTTEAFSAVVGGVDSLHTNSFNESIGLPDEFSRRIARNLQVMLNEESHLGKIVDPAGGSYFVEKLTDEVANKTFELFKEIEAKGGMLKALEDGSVQAAIESVVADKKKDFSKRKAVLVGTNMYANTKEEKISAQLPDYANLLKTRSEYLQKYRVSGATEKHQSILNKLQQLADSSDEAVTISVEAFVEGATLGEVASSTRANGGVSVEIKPVKLQRLAELFEELRDAVEAYKAKNGGAPKLFLANMGSVKQHKGRADFSRGFFEVGGFDVVYPGGFETPEAAAKAAVESGAKVVTICSTDDTYPELVPPFVKAVKELSKDMVVVLAGYPKDQIEAHKATGVDEFIFMGADVHGIISNLFKKLGVM